MTATRGAAFTTTMRVIDRVLGNTARQRALAHPALATGLGEVLVAVVGVRNRANGAHAGAGDVTLFARVQTDHHHAAVAPYDLCIGACRTCDLTALARLHFHIVDDGADRHLRQLHGVARLHVGLFAGDHGIAHSQTLRRQDIGQFAVFVLDQRDERGAVGIIFDPLHSAGDVKLATLEVDDAVTLLVTASDAARSHVTLVVAATGLSLAFGQRLDLATLVQVAAVDKDQAATARACRIIGFECHICILSACRPRSDAGGDVDRLAFGQTNNGFLDVGAGIGTTLPALGLALLDEGVDTHDLDIEQRFDRSLDLRLGGVLADLEDHRVAFAEQR